MALIVCFFLFSMFLFVYCSLAQPSDFPPGSVIAASLSCQMAPRLLSGGGFSGCYKQGSVSNSLHGQWSAAPEPGEVVQVEEPGVKARQHGLCQGTLTVI